MLRRVSNVPEIEAGPPLGGDISGAVGRTDGDLTISFGAAFATGTALAAGEAFAGVDAGDAAATVGLVGGPIEMAGIAGRDRGPFVPIWMGCVMMTAGGATTRGASAAGFAAGDLAADAGDGRAGGCRGCGGRTRGGAHAAATPMAPTPSVSAIRAVRGRRVDVRRSEVAALG